MRSRASDGFTRRAFWLRLKRIYAYLRPGIGASGVLGSLVGRMTGRGAPPVRRPRAATYTPDCVGTRVPVSRAAAGAPSPGDRGTSPNGDRLAVRDGPEQPPFRFGGSSGGPTPHAVNGLHQCRQKTVHERPCSTTFAVTVSRAACGRTRGDNAPSCSSGRRRHRGGVGGSCKSPIRGNRKLRSLRFAVAAPSVDAVGFANGNGATDGCTDGRSGCS